MFEQMCAQIRDVLLSPTHSCCGVLVLQVAGTIQSPLNMMKLFSMTEGRRVTLQSAGTQHLHLSSYSRASFSQLTPELTARGSGSSSQVTMETMTGVIKMLSTTTGLIK